MNQRQETLVDALELSKAVYVRGTRKSDPARLAAAEAKRARKNAKRLRDLNDSPLPSTPSKEC